MSRRTIPVRDHVGRKVLFHETKKRAAEMIGSGTAFVLVADPLEIALTRGPSEAARDARPDLSLTMPPGVILGAADGSKKCEMIIESYRTNHERPII